MFKRKISFLLLLLLVVSACTRKVSTSKEPAGTPPKGEVSAMDMLFEQHFDEGMKQYITGHYNTAKDAFEKAYGINPNNGGLNYMLGKISLMKDEDAKAILYTQKAIKTDPKNKYYAIQLAEIYEKQFKYEEAIKVYKKLIAEIPGTSEYLYDLGALYIYNKNYSEAIQVYNKVESIYGKSPELTLQKQKLYVGLNKLDMAIAEGESLIKTYPEVQQYKIDQAEFLYSNGRTAEAQKILEQVLQESPNDPYAHLAMSDIYSSQGKHEQAAAELETVFKSEDMDLKGKLMILEATMQGPRSARINEEILKLSKILVEQYPTESGPHAALGESYLLLGRKEEAWNSFIKAKQYEKSNYQLWVKLIMLDSELSKSDSVIAHAEEALETFPNQADLWFYKGVALYQKKEYRKAVDDLDQSIKMAGSNKELKVSAYGMIGDAYNAIKSYKLSDEAYDKALAINPDDDHVLNNYSYFLSMRKERLDYALSLSSKLVKLYPENPSYLDTHGWVLYTAGNYSEAKKYLELAASKSNSGTIIEHYGDVLFKLGQKDLAVEQWKKAKQTGKASALIDKKIQDKQLYE